MKIDSLIPGWASIIKINCLVKIVEFYVINNDGPISILEIGTFLGRSLVNISSNVREKDKITSVDDDRSSFSSSLFKDQLTSTNSPDSTIDGDLIKWKKLLNMKIFDARKAVIKEFLADEEQFTYHGRGSSNFFKKNSEKFDIIYVDGDHFMPTVKNDLKNSYRNLNPGGIR